MKAPFPSAISQNVSRNIPLPIAVFILIALLSMWWYAPPIIEQNVRGDAVRAAVHTAE